MRAVHDLKDLCPVVREIAEAAEDPEIYKGREPPPAPGRRPTESDRHELDDRALPGDAVREMHLNGGRHES